MAALSDSLDFSDTVLDLDDVSNIGHPCWEYLDPNPDVQQLFKRFNDLFFDGVCRNRVNVKWIHLDNDNAGETFPPQNPDNKVHIYLNINLLRNRLRKEIVEQLLHEMIHAYLIRSNEEDEGEYRSLDENNRERSVSNHGPNYQIRMMAINEMTKLNVTMTHDLPTGKKSKSKTIDGIDKCYLWYCRGDCRKQVPYFGFIWVKEDCEPNPDDSMWTDGCEHAFERYGDPKLWLTEWECVTIFNRFITANKIKIKSRKMHAADFNGHLNDNRDEDSFAICFGEESKISNDRYVNYDDETGTFISLEEFYPNLYADLHEPNCTICTICFHVVAECNVIEHLKDCSGLTFSINDSNLPFIMINNLNQN